MARTIWHRLRSARPARKRPVARSRPTLEALEDRVVPSTTLQFSDGFNRANSSTLGANWTERTLATPIGIFGNAAAPTASASGASIATVNPSATADGTTQVNTRLIFDENLGASGASTRAFGAIARYLGPGDRGMYLGWIARRGGATYAELWVNDPGNDNWYELTALSVSNVPATIVFDVVSATSSQTSLALYRVDSPTNNLIPLVSAFDSTAGLQTAAIPLGGQFGIRSWAFRPTLDNFTAERLNAFGYGSGSVTFPYSQPFSTTSTDTYLNDDFTGRTGQMTVNNATGVVSMASSGLSLTTLNSSGLTNGGWTGRAAGVQAHADVSGVAQGSTGAAGFATNWAGSYFNNLYYGWVSSRPDPASTTMNPLPNVVSLEIHSRDPGDEDDILASTPMPSTADTSGSLQFTAVGNYLTLSYVPDGNAGDATTITTLDFHANPLGPGQVGIVGLGTGATLGGNTVGTQFSAFIPSAGPGVSLPYDTLNTTNDNFYDNSTDWTSQLGNLVHVPFTLTSPAAPFVVSQPLGDPEEGTLTASIATLNGPNTHNDEQTAFVDLSGATTGSNAVLGGVVSSYTGTNDKNMYLGALVIRNGVPSVEIDKNVGGVWTYLVSSPTSVPPGSGAVQSGAALPAGVLSGKIDFTVDSTNTLRLTFSNDNLADGFTTTITVHDTSFTGGGLMGIRTYGSGVVVNQYTAAMA